MKNGMKRVLSAVLALCLCLTMLPAVTIRAEAASYYSESDLGGVKSSILSNTARASYVNDMMRYHIMSSTDNYRVARNLKDGKSIVFFFDGCSDNVDDGTYGDYTRYHLSAYCAVVEEVNGVLDIVYESENCSTIPDNPRNTSLNDGTAVPTVLDGVYNITSKNHNGRYAALHIADNNGTAPVIRCTASGSYVSTSGAINIHARSNFGSAPKNGISSSSYSSTGCFNVGLTDNTWSEYNSFIYQVLGISKAIITTPYSDGSWTKCTEGIDKGLVIVDRSQYKTQLAAIYGGDNNRTASALVSKITSYTDNLDYSGHTTHTYTGSYHDDAHPHKVYQKCSCGATQYTGATTTVSSCASCNPVSTVSKYNAVLSFKAYLKGTSTVYPYSDPQMTTASGGQIWSTDECTISAVYSNGACKVTYPTGNGPRDGYVSLSNFVGNTSASLTAQTVSRKIDTYIRASTSSTQYGYTASGDVIYKLGTSGNMTQIFYPTSNGYKLAWVVTSELTEPTYDTRFNPYCPIKGYPCATATFNVYESDHSTYVGKIFTADYCTINAVYADGWCHVTYPTTSSGDKSGYTQLSNFVYNISATHVKYTANAQIKVHKDKSLPGDLNWYISSGDQFFVVGSYGSTSQVLYPLDAQYGGGYKLGWISTSNLPKTTYTVTYNANGGSSAPSSQTKTHGTPLTLSTAVPTRTGYQFVGWGTSASATSASYAPGASYTTDANLTLYAVWTLNRYEISYNANGGTNAPASQSKTHGTNLTLTTSVPSKYYTVTFNANGGSVDVSSRQIACQFLGWATSASATTAAYQPGGTFTTNANTTLYAVWKNPALAQYSIPVREGYVFDGWYTAASGGTQVTISTTVSSNMTVYAHWTAATYIVNYDANGGTGAPASQTKKHGTNLTLSTIVPTKSNYTFLGWATEENPDSVQYQPGGIYSADSDIMLIAVWEQATLTSLTVLAKPTKTSYYVGETLDTTGLKLTATYNNGTTQTITSGFSCTPTTLNTAGTQTITVSYGGKSTTFTVTVSAVTLTALSVASKPTKTSYYVGETLDTTGLKLTATYNNGTTQTITSGFSCTPTILNTAGTQTITVSYGGKSTTFTVTVNAVTLTALSVASKPTKTTYYVGETLDTTGLKLTATYSNGTTQTITSGFSCTPTTLNTAGTQTITVSYGGKSTTFTVTVNPLPTGALTVGSVSGSPGETVQIPIVLNPNPGLIAARLKISYDSSALTLTGAADGGILGEYVFGGDLSANPYIVMWENGLAGSNFTGTGTLVTLTFRVKESASEGTFPITVSYDPDEVYDYDMVNVSLSVTQGSVTVESPQYLASGTCGNNLSWTLNNQGVLTVSGTGAMKNYEYKSEMPWYSYQSQIKSVVLESGVTSIGDYAFYGMPAMTSIQIPATVNAIGDYAFKNSSALNGVILPEKLTKLGDSAFYACTSLTSIEIPAKLYTIKPYTFKNCTALAEVTFHEGNLEKISDGAFYNTALTELVLPDCLNILDMYTFKNCSKLRSIELGSGLSEIREAAFYGSAIPTITIPEGVTKIGPYAFKNCTRLVSIDLPSTLTSIGEASFYACTALESLDMPDAVTAIGDYAFRKCAALIDVSFGSGLVNIGESSFYGCEGLVYLNIPKNVTTIQGYAFKGCTDLEIVNLPASLVTLGDSAFHTCTSLSEITIPANVTKIGEYCFSGSYNIRTIFFDGNAPTIGSGAFSRITATAYYPSGNSTWTASVRQNYGGSITWMAN